MRPAGEVVRGASIEHPSSILHGDPVAGFRRLLSSCPGARGKFSNPIDRKIRRNLPMKSTVCYSAGHSCDALLACQHAHCVTNSTWTLQSPTVLGLFCPRGRSTTPLCLRIGRDIFYFSRSFRSKPTVC